MRALALFALVLFGCPPSKDKGPESKPCASVGQTCEVSPGKLGSCVRKDDCSGADTACFVCQSQH
jgi:hypothetical protein